GTRIEAQRGDDQLSGADPNRVEIRIESGTLNALGTAASRILFTSSAPSPRTDDWAGFRFNSGVPANLNMKFCTVEFATTLFVTVVDLATAAGGMMEDCIFRNAADHAVLARTANVNFTRCTMRDIGDYAFAAIITGTANFTDCTFEDIALDGQNLAMYLSQGTYNFVNCTWRRCRKLVILGDSLSVLGGSGAIPAAINLRGCLFAQNVGDWAVVMYGPVLNIQDTTFTENMRGVFHNNATVSPSVTALTRCTFVRQGGLAIRVFMDNGGNEEVHITNCLITQNNRQLFDGVAVDFPTINSGTDLIEIANTAISGNRQDGVRFSVGSSGTRLFDVHASAFTDNGGDGIRFEGDAPGIISGFTDNNIFGNRSGIDWRHLIPDSANVPNNYWGPTTTAELDAGSVNLSRIFDLQDDPARGQVVVRPYRSAPPSGTPLPPTVVAGDAGNTFLKITFSLPMNVGDVTNPVNYTAESPIGNPIDLSGATFTWNPSDNSVTISGLTLLTGASYRVTLASVRSVGGDAMIQDGRGNVAGGFVRDTIPPIVVNASATNLQVRVFFSKDMRRAEVESPANYQLNGAPLPGETIAAYEAVSRSVALNLPDASSLPTGSAFTIAVNAGSVFDLVGNPIGTPRSFSGVVLGKTLTLPTGARGVPSATLLIPILIDNPFGIKSGSLVITYDPAVLNLTDAQTTPITTGATLTKTFNNVIGRAQVDFDLPSASSSSTEGTLLFLVGNVPGSATFGANTGLTFDAATALRDSAGTAMPLTRVNGQLTVFAPRGDIDRSGPPPNAGDAILALRMAVNLPIVNPPGTPPHGPPYTAEELLLSDLNGDSATNSADGILILRAAAGMPVVYDVEPRSAREGSLISIIGWNFGATQGSSTVAVGGVNATVVTWSDTQIVAQVPTGAGITGVTVTVGTNTSNPFPFTPTTGGAQRVLVSVGTLERRNVGTSKHVNVSTFQRERNGHLVVPLVVDDLRGVAGGDMTLTFNAAAGQVVEVQPSKEMNGVLFSSRVDNQQGVVQIAFAGSDELGRRRGTVAEIVFAPRRKTAAVSRTPLRVQTARLYDENARGLQVTTGNSKGGGKPRLLIARMQATPAGEGVMIHYWLTQPAVVEGRVFTPTGKVVRSFAPVHASAVGSLFWEGRQQNGSPAPRGIYFVELRARDEEGAEVKMMRTVVRR
ncbi:MAG: cohesin domain-containing protein, partial [Abditibacteriales bacterium]|nr:cohesin domain-containing protein [Abditibacteriales bacterium]